MKLAEVSIKRPSLVIVMLAALIIGGIFSYKSLSYELIPKMDIKVLSISTIYPGAGPAEVESTVSKKIEDAVSSLENVKKIQTKSYEGVSIVVIFLNNDANVDNSLNDAQRKVNAIRSDLPEDAKEPSITKFSLSDLPVATMGVTANLSDSELYDIVDQKIQPAFSRIGGVAQVNIVGGREREIRVSIDQNKAEGYGLSIVQIQQIIQASNMEFPTGSLKTRENTTLLRLSGNITSVEELRNLTLASQNGINIRLSDVADVQDAQKQAEKIATINGKSTLLLQVMKQSDANAVEVSERIQAKIQDIEKQYQKEGIKVQLADDTSVFTLEAANSVMKDLLIAIALVAFVMLFFLHSLRNALIVMVAIPTSLIATFIGMLMFGYTLNLMSLLALSLVVGILVDDAIVVIENIHRHMEMGKNKYRAAYDGASEIGFTVVAITMVIVVVFVPIAMSTGMVSDIIRQFAVVVVISTLLSLLVSFTVVPWLFSRFGKLEHISPNHFLGKVIYAFERQLDRFTHWMSDLLKWSLHHKLKTFAVTFVLFVSSFALFALGYIGADFFPTTERSKFLIQFELNKDASLEQMNFVTQKAEAYILNQPEVLQTISTVGQSSTGMGAVQATPYKSEISVEIVDKKNRTEQSAKVYAAKLSRALEQELTGVKVKIVPMGIMGVEQAPLQMNIIGNSLEEVMKYAREAEALLKTVPGANQVELSVEEGNPEIAIQVDRDKMTALGLNVVTVGQTLRTAFSGNTDSKFRTGNNEYDINVILDDVYRTDIENIRSISFTNPQGMRVKLAQFAQVHYASGPSLLERYDRSPSVTINAQVVGRTGGAIANEWQEKLQNVEKPAAVEWTWGGNMENQAEGFGTLGIAMIAAMMFVYMVMVILYNDFIRPFIVMFSIPLSFIGALWGLALTNESLNIFTILGIIMLVGLVAKNAILLVDFANHRLEEGETIFDALVQANHARLRPILMTTIAMVIGMLPIALASGEASSMNNGLAIVIIGGLLSSLFLTLIIVPVVYMIFVSLEERFFGHKTIDVDAKMKEPYEHKQIPMK